MVTPEQPGQGLPAVELRAEGWFWPPNTPGVAGVAITSALVRTAMLPIGLQPWPLSLRPGDPAVALTLRIGSLGPRCIISRTVAITSSRESRRGRQARASVLFPGGGGGSGGRPGAGSVSGGTAGPQGSRLVTVSADTAAFTYQPPGAPADDQLVVCVARADTGAGASVGIELARSSDLDPLLDRMHHSRLHIEHVSPGSPLFCC